MKTEEIVRALRATESRSKRAPQSWCYVEAM